ncbi:coagulation factor X-like [Bradysia coprophila]|uniref:coagulation factor X-like n=1 Tax=Bradysia coprophila TaxID=38358 RepID=UPI00187DC122|nr:coagulation factor X-like [Bradysia coprophila]
MEGLFLLFFVLIVGSQAVPFSRVANGEISSNANHACMVLVIRSELKDTGTAVLGSGSIVSRRHVLTAAHLLYGEKNTYQINFFIERSRRSFQSTFSIIHENYDEDTYHSDIGLIFLQGVDYFSVLNVIPISTVDVPVSVVGTVTGYGFTSETSRTASLEPMSANQTVTAYCVFSDFEAAETHFCALDSASSSIICPGDNGAGLYIKNTTTGANELIGVASRIMKGCSKTDYTGYTRLSLFATWVNEITNM